MQLSTVVLLHKGITAPPAVMACRPYVPYVLAIVALLLGIGLILFAICMERPQEPSNELKTEKISTEQLENFFSGQPEAVLPLDSGLDGSVAGDVPDLVAKALFLVGTTTTKATTLSTMSLNRMEMEHSTTTTEVCFQSFR